MAKKKINTPIGYWRVDEGGYETNHSTEVITTTLRRLKKNRGFVNILQKGYQSGNTIIIRFDDKHLLIDKPKDWPNTKTSIRVVFKDEFQLWNHFTVRIVTTGKDTLKTTFPTELFRLQRRAHFRIEVPSKSKASFTMSKASYQNGALVNISVGGMKLFMENQGNIIQEQTNDLISNIELTIYPNQEKDEKIGLPLTIRKGKVVRETLHKKRNSLEIGVQFSTATPEEKILLEYVRKRELELLRKGIKE